MQTRDTATSQSRNADVTQYAVWARVIRVRASSVTASVRSKSANHNSFCLKQSPQSHNHTHTQVSKRNGRFPRLTVAGTQTANIEQRENTACTLIRVLFLFTDSVSNTWHAEYNITGCKLPELTAMLCVSSTSAPCSTVQQRVILTTSYQL